ncbi:MAG: D-2-hydroxyacid dehydrogenase [Gammaproteobacteria bacterium]|nr:D-2-hydroxyacid dehydrogenase [Gammaproteobacteria bacterium]
MRIVFLDRNTFSDSIVFPVAGLAGCEWREFARTAPDEILARAADAGTIVTNKVKLPGALLERLPKLKLIAVAATGVDHIDVEAARHLGIGVCNVRDYAIHSVPEHVFALLLALKRNLPGLQAAARDGRWSASDSFTLHTHAIHDLAGGTLGILGVGTLGRAVARLATAFGMRVLLAERRGVASPRPGRAAFAQVLRESDVLSVHAPLMPETRQLIGAAEFAQMKPGAILINCARGGVVDEAALLAALRAGRLAGAGIDVLAQEPPPADHPLLTADLPNLIVTPHVAWASRQAQQKLADEIVANIAAFMRGETRNRVA